MGKVTHRCLEGSEEEGKLRAAGGRGVSGQLFDYCHDLASGSATWGKTGRQTGGMWVAFVVRWASEKAEEGGGGEATELVETGAASAPQVVDRLLRGLIMCTHGSPAALLMTYEAGHEWDFCDVDHGQGGLLPKVMYGP